MIPYIINVGLILSGCIVFYKLLLQKETFYQVNRWVLITCLLIAFSLPLIRVPQDWSLRKAEEISVVNNNKTNTQIPQNITVKESKESTPIINAIDSSPAESKVSNPISFQKLLTYLVYLYWFGVIAFGLSFLLQITILMIRAYRNPAIVHGGFRIIEMSGDKAPCSFGNMIFINPEKYDWETYNQILAHEKVHIQQGHSMDILIAEIVLIFQWFNPFAWIYRKEVENNLEYLTDDHLVKHKKVERSSYQLSLLKVTSPDYPLRIATNYNQSLLKKRIVMMNAKRSNLHTAWKYFFLLPLCVLLACLLNEPVAKAQTKQPTSSSKSTTTTKESTNTNVKEEVKEVPKTKQNAQEQPKRKTQTKNTGGVQTEGSWFATIKGDKINIQFKSDDDEYSHNTSSFDLKELGTLPRGTAGTFKLTREAGTMEFTGKFDGDQGMGKYKFVPDNGYRDKMNGEIKEKLSDRDVMVFFFVDIKMDYVQMLKRQGFSDFGKNDLIPMAALNINEPYIRSIKDAGFKDIEMKELIPLSSLHIDGDYIKEIRSAGYPDISTHQLIAFKAQGIDKEYIQKVRKASDEDSDDPGQIVALKSLNIDDDYINSFKSVGMTNISNRDLIPMKSLGITPQYVKGFQAIGYKDIEPKDLIPLKSQGITPEYIKSFEAAGFKDIELHQIISVKAMNITPAYIKSMRQKGFDYKKIDKYIQLKSIGDND